MQRVFRSSTYSFSARMRERIASNRFNLASALGEDSAALVGLLLVGRVSLFFLILFLLSFSSFSFLLLSSRF